MYIPIHIQVYIFSDTLLIIACNYYISILHINYIFVKLLVATPSRVLLEFFCIPQFFSFTEELFIKNNTFLTGHSSVAKPSHFRRFLVSKSERAVSIEIHKVNNKYQDRKTLMYPFFAIRHVTYFQLGTERRTIDAEHYFTITI